MTIVSLASQSVSLLFLEFLVPAGGITPVGKVGSMVGKVPEIKVKAASDQGLSQFKLAAPLLPIYSENARTIRGDHVAVRWNRLHCSKKNKLKPEKL
ncbi:hypothetical protein CEXT_270051 [Caerostris extrusa]|uniref:Uncharacterized protein n=1 Tax=Caerostris extrusa TaxID=172846 RepID=A0AAV4SR44_CAEEX|nr:hypothetical protein CEXT_270051 [Caerostris extrusa]